MDEIKLVKKSVEKDDKTFVNFYVVINGVYIAVKPTFKNDYYFLTKVAEKE